MALLAVHLNPSSGTPYYVQLVEQVRRAIRFGLLCPGDQLPTVREVVAAVAVNPNTVLRAYRELASQGLVVMRQGSGTFVVDGPHSPVDGEVYETSRRELEQWIDRARARGLDEETLAALFDHVMQDTRREVEV